MKRTRIQIVSRRITFLGLGFRFWSFVAVFCLFLSVTCYFLLIGLLYTKSNIYRLISADNASLDEFDRILFRHFVRRGEEWRLYDEDKACPRGGQLFGSETVKGCYMNCADLKKIHRVEYIASGWTKSAYHTTLGYHKFVVKVVNIHGHDMHECLQATPNIPHCYRKTAVKILNEIIYLKLLQHPNIIKILGYCIPYQEMGQKYNTVAMLATEAGEMVDVIHLLQLSWENRLRVALGIADLLAYLSQSPLGTAAIRDFRRQQFVLVHGVLKLSDADDLVFLNPKCKFKSDCAVWAFNNTHNISAICHRGVCIDYNEKFNLLHAATQFMNFIIIHGAPTQLQTEVQKIMKAYQTASLSSTKIKEATAHLVREFSVGTYRKTKIKHLTDFLENKGCDLPGKFDYNCYLSISDKGCVFSVSDAEEAAEICSTDSVCQAFVITKQQTWTGMVLVSSEKDEPISMMIGDKEGSL